MEFPPMELAAKSSLPSPLKSPATIAHDPAVVAVTTGAWNVPFPLPSATLMVLLRLDTAMSCLPSPLKSPTATAPSEAPAATLNGVKKAGTVRSSRCSRRS